MPKVMYFLLCEKHAIEDDGKASIIGTFNTVMAEGLPANVGLFSFAICVEDISRDDLGPGAPTLIIEIIDTKNGKVVVEAKAKAEKKIPDGPFSIRTTIDMSNKITIPKEGSFLAKLKLNETELSTLTFNVEKIKGDKK